MLAPRRKGGEVKPSFWRDNFSYGGELRQETAYRITPPHNFTKIKQIAKMYFKFKFNDHLKMRIGGRAFYDAVYDLTDQYPDEGHCFLGVPRGIRLDHWEIF